MTAILATFADFKLIKTRQCAQFVLEVPIEAADAALEALGGLPRSDIERWVGIAPIDATAVAARPADGGAPHASVKGGDKPRLRFHEMPRSQQAALKCNDPVFQQWLANAHGNRLGVCCDPLDPAPVCAAKIVRKVCDDIGSRADLDTNATAGQRWDLMLSAFEADTGRMAERR